MFKTLKQHVDPVGQNQYVDETYADGDCKSEINVMHTSDWKKLTWVVWYSQKLLIQYKKLTMY